MDIILDMLTVTAIISVICVVLLVLLLVNCCRMRNGLRMIFPEQ